MGSQELLNPRDTTRDPYSKDDLRADDPGCDPLRDLLMTSSDPSRSLVATYGHGTICY